MEEPNAKRPRSAIEESHNDQRYKSIQLDMEKYNKWVRNLKDEELVSMFELGVRVKESVVFTMDVNQDFMKKALSSQMQPVQETVTNIEKEVKQQVQSVQESVSRDVCENVKKMANDVLSFKDELSKNIKSIGNKLEADVKSVTEKVPPLNLVKEEIKETEKRITHVLEKQNEQLIAISATLANSNKKGALAGKKVLAILNENLRRRSFTFTDTSKERGKADIEAHSPDGHKIMIEVKYHANPVPKQEVESFEKNLAMCNDFKVGILLSTSSGIAMRSKGSIFEVTFSQEERQYRIYVPNAQYVNNELIVWSVVMAAELAKTEVGDLGDTKTQKLQTIYTEFQQNVQHSQNCRDSLKALQNSMKKLQENIVPILDTVDKTRSDIYKLLLN